MGTAVAGVLLLTACGFQPLYGTGRDADASAQLAEVKIERIAERRGQILRNELLDRMNPRGEPARPSYRLAIDTAESLQGLGIREDDTATLARLTLTANFSLFDAATQESLLSGSATSINSYNISTSEFATDSAEADARRRGARDLAEDITARVAIFLAQSGRAAAEPR